MTTTPEPLIDAFDRCLIYVYGQTFARDNPNRTDMETAKRWIALGADQVIVSWVFFDRMSWMHEKHVRGHDRKDRTNVPGSLKVFDDNVEAAVRRVKGIGQIDAWEADLSLWRSRLKGWKKFPQLWRTEMWGPPPFEAGCRAPKSMLHEFTETRPTPAPA